MNFRKIVNFPFKSNFYLRNPLTLKSQVKETTMKCFSGTTINSTLNKNQSFKFSSLVKNSAFHQKCSFCDYSKLFIKPTPITIQSINSTSNTSKRVFYFFTAFYMRSYRKKLKTILAKYEPKKAKNRKALTRRIVVVGPAFDRHFLFKRAGNYHKREKKSNNNLKRPKLRLVPMVYKSWVKRNFPYWKFKRYKNLKRCK